MVRLPNGKLVKGKLWKYDIHYNVAVVMTESFKEFPSAQVCNEVQFNHGSSHSNLVAIGRCYDSGELMATSGTLLYKTSEIDLLMFSSCKTTKVLPLSHFLFCLN
jgi:hypothetical protein